ncbi:hypothetical protein AB0J14_29535 [Micromonospora arborensis]|uniref:hypothetical protein n=1 Tax=Micromonospora arborensis TaxID=2116518 RepID=UPI0033C3A9EF
MAQQPTDPSDAFAELGRIKLGETDLPGVLTRVSELARRTIPGAEEVSVTLMRQKGAHTAAFSGEMALRLDELQYKYGQAPCLDAAKEGTVVSVADMAAEARWPRWSPHHPTTSPSAVAPATGCAASVCSWAARLRCKEMRRSIGVPPFTHFEY